jgi:hypothetical protein
MPKEIFDQARPQRKSAMAQRLDDAFAGCEEWTLAPPSPRRADALDIAPWLSSSSARPTSLPASGEPESRAA